MTTETPILCAAKVEALFKECLVPLDAPMSPSFIEVEGVINKALFHPDPVDKRRSEIASLLAQLPDQFHDGLGGGWSFLNACQDRNGHLWTGLHQTMEQLFMLGIACGLAREITVIPRDILPGNMPYYAVSKEVRGNHDA